uniref:Disease resistance N-terminal domain-containing protein n=1 Tax=Oryza punctata TaxID=4537 RepID=A0A0E0M6P0_ORYPU
MAEAIVGPLLSKLQEVALREGKALAEVGGEIDRLRDKLMWLHAFVYETDLRSRHDGNKLLRVLACQMREVAFEAEDAIDHFSLEADLSRLYWRRAVIKFFAKFHKQISVRYILSRKIKAMNARLEHIVENSGTYAMEHGSTADGKSWRSCQTIPPIRQDW